MDDVPRLRGRRRGPRRTIFNEHAKEVFALPRDEQMRQLATIGAMAVWGWEDLGGPLSEREIKRLKRLGFLLSVALAADLGGELYQPNPPES